MTDDSYVRELMELAKSLGVEVDLRCNVGDKELVQLYRSASLFVYAPRLEPFGLAPLEAAACGLVTLGVAEAGTRESITGGENGFLVPADEATFAQTIDELLGDRAGLAKMACLACENVVQHWSVEGAALRVESVLRRVAAMG